MAIPPISHTYATAGAFNASITVTSDKGCTGTAGPVVANVFPKPVANFTAVQTETRGIETDHELTFTGSGAALYSWFFHDGQTSSSPGPVKVTFKEQGLKPVKLVVLSADGCMDSLTKTILLNPALQMWITNTFSPNDDGLNEQFGPSTTFGLTNYHMLIYDRWGAKMFESRDPAVRWTGNDDKGELAIEGVYAYSIVFRYVDGKLFVYRGTVTLLR
jgi:gliding motility-associated-like protein